MSAATPGLRTQARRLFAGALVASLVAGATGVLAVVYLLDVRSSLVDRVDPALVQSASLLGALVDQETGVRGFALTGDDAFLEPYQRGIQSEAQLRAALDGSLHGVDTAIEPLADIDRAIAAWHEGYATPTIAAVEAGDVDPSTEESLSAGRRSFDQVRASVADLDAVLDVARVDRRDRLNDSTVYVVAALAALVAIAAGAPLLSWRGFRRSVEEPLLALGDDAGRVADGELGHRIADVGPPEVLAVAQASERMRARILEELDAVVDARVELEEQAEELRRSNAELEQFAYVASHDLQEPLRKITSFCQLLQRRYEGQLDDRADEYIGFAVDGAKRMQILINDLLAFSRVGRLTGPFEDVDLDGCLDRALDNLSSVIEEAGAVIERSDLPEVHGDPHLLAAVFQNLVGNAVKFRRPDTKPVVRLSSQLVDDGAAWEIAVADDGIGIEPQFAERVFVIFQRLHGKDAFEGTGIGLALCRKIVEHHGGRIWIDPDVAAGTTIRFTIPIPVPPAPPDEAAPPDEEGTTE